MNRNSGSGFFVFLLFIIFFGVGGTLLSGLISLLPVFIVIALISGITKSNTQNQRGKEYSSVRQGNSSARAKSLSNRDRNRIDAKLTSYFKDNYKLPVFENIALTTRNGSYTVIEDLYISVEDELILSMEEFKNLYPDVYNRIIELLMAFTKQTDDVMKATVKVPEVKKEEVLSDAQKYIDKINALNTDIANEEVTNGLYQTCALLKQIDLASKNKEDEKLTKLYDYYLPILTGILENYKTLHRVGAQNEEFKQSEVQLIKTIVLINEALKTMNNALHEDDYMNLSADITTLQSLLKKDGLVDDSPFNKE